MKKRFFALIPFIAALTSCTLVNSNTTTVEETTTEGGAATTTKTTTTTTIDIDDTSSLLSKADFSTRVIPNQDSVKYEDLFNLGNVVSISIDMEDSELQKLQEDLEYYTSTSRKNQLYRHCKSVTITLKNYDNTFTWTYEDVGIRQKGNTSRKDEWPILNDSGEICHLNHFKLSFDETFDDEEYGADAYDWSNDAAGYSLRKDREFLGLTGLDLKWNKNYDATHIKEVYASKLYKAAGLISQNIGLSNFEINQVDKNKTYDMGVYTLYEPAKKSLIKNTLKNEDILNFGTWNEEKSGTYGATDSKYGDLYKCKWGLDLTYNNMYGNIGVGTMDGSYVPLYERKTNTSDTSYKDTLLLALGNAVSSSNYDNISEKLDLEYFAATEAVNYFVGNPDDLRNNTNNTMIYMRRSDGKGVTIPIDNDRAFGITTDWPVKNGMTEVGPMDNEKAVGGSVISLYKKTILKKDSGAYKYYVAYLTALYNSDWLKSETFNSLFEIAKASYSSTVSSTFDSIGFNLNDNNVSFANYISAKKNLCKSYVGDTSSNDDTTTTTTTITTTPTDGYYGDAYLNGDFCGWSFNNTNYKFTYNGDGEYTITFTPGAVSSDSKGNYIKCKIYDGADYSSLDWSIDTEANALILDGKSASSFYIYGVEASSNVTITVNTLTLEASITIE